MRFTLVRQTNLTQKGRQENRIYFCMHVKIYIYIYIILNYICIYVIPTNMYIVYMREVFLMSNADTEAQDKKYL